MINDKQIQEFRSKMRGRLVTPSDEGYDRARAVYNAMIDKRPAFIAQCVDVADVMAAVKFGGDSGLTVAVRGGGHSGPGLGTVDDGLVIDLGRMKGVRVDPGRRKALVQGGCVWGDVDHATHPFGLAAPGGFVSTTGVGGLTLGGGVGYLSRRVGLAVDSLVSADVVLADGRLVTASASENADLFWGLCGGGGNFGVVISFEFQLHPVDTVYGGPMIWPMERAADLLPLWRDHVLRAPEEHSGWFGFLTVPPGPPFPQEYHLHKMCAVIWCDSGPMDQAEKRMADVRRQFGKPAIDFAGPIPWPALTSLFDPLFPPGLRWYWKSDFFKDLSGEAVALDVQHGAALPTILSTMHIYPVNGAAQRVRKGDSAYSFRDANFIQMIAAVDPDAANDEQMIAWARDFWKALHPHSAGAGYVNMSMDEGQTLVRAAYRDNYQRLVDLKKKYDPTNLFRVNQNINPA